MIHITNKDGELIQYKSSETITVPKKINLWSCIFSQKINHFDSTESVGKEKN